jgi:DNA polymerase-3 subunit gamma/tau
MTYVVLARKYRPANLAELIGQPHIARALTNAIAMNRVAHAFLFCGARGTGKTSTARIVAKMLNCEQGPTEAPCGQCAACREIATGTCIDVHELDAASNRGINEIRELREGVAYAPARDRNKVYIIDEAHMLTNEAANAFLKTLEEPPPHVVFILATTDPQRLPVTIRSRCQRYDFRRIRSSQIVERLGQICEQESTSLNSEALYLIARESEGSMRDALSVLDQVIAFGGESIQAEEVAALLGVADRNRTLTLMSALLNRQPMQALQATASAHQHGIDLRTFSRTLAQEARDLLVIRLTGATARDLVDRADSEIKTLEESAIETSTAELERLSQVLLEIAEKVANARHPRLVLEMGVVRLCQAASLVDVAELAVRVEGLLRGSTRRAPAAATKPETATRQAPPRPQAGKQQARPSQAAAETTTKQRPPAASELAAKNKPSKTTSASRSSDDGDSTAQATDAEPDERRGRSLKDADMATWQRALGHDLEQPVVASLLDHAVINGSGPGRVEIAFFNEFFSKQAQQDGNLVWFARAATRAFGGNYQVEVGDCDDRARTQSLAAQRQQAMQGEVNQEISSLKDDSSVQTLIEMVGGTLTETVSETELAATGLSDG